VRDKSNISLINQYNNCPLKGELVKLVPANITFNKAWQNASHSLVMDKHQRNKNKENIA
jgi:hypothetical protein